ncbi:MAG: transposase [Candidatus Zhuqueibacterota bacterium]
MAFGHDKLIKNVILEKVSGSETNIEPVRESLYWYRKRFKIETMFSDKKSRGFNIHKSHISRPERVAKLLIVAALAYIFIIYFGLLATHNDFMKNIHRIDRCDLSLFTLGLRALEYLLNHRKKNVSGSEGLPMLRHHITHFLEYCKNSNFSNRSIESLECRLLEFNAFIQQQPAPGIGHITYHHLIQFVAESACVTFMG